MGDGDLDIDAASATPSVGVEKCDDLVPSIEELFRLMTKALPVLSQGRHVRADSVVAPDGMAAECRQVRLPRHVRIELGQHSVNVPAVARLVYPLRGGHVLPRHRTGS